MQCYFVQAINHLRRLALDYRCNAMSAFRIYSYALFSLERTAPAVVTLGPLLSDAMPISRDPYSRHSPELERCLMLIWFAGDYLSHLGRAMGASNPRVIGSDWADPGMRSIKLPSISYLISTIYHIGRN
jgi:hypothetical protein